MFLGRRKHLATGKPTTQKAPPKAATLLFAWCGVIIAALIFAIITEISARRHDYERDALTLIKETELRWGGQEAVLSGFAAFLKAVDKGDRLAAKRYAASALDPYPHIYMLEVARRVPARKVRAFERSMQVGQHQDYKVSSFGSGREPSNVGTNGDTWPIVFLYPESPAVRSIYGIKLETVPYLTEALSKLEEGQRMVATKPFSLIEGGSGFMLLANVDRQDREQPDASPNYFGSSMIAMLMMKSDDVIPNPPLSLGRIQADLLDSQGTTRATLMARPDRLSLPLDRFLLPTFTVQQAIKSKCLPVAITIEHQLLWRELVTGRLVQFLALISVAVNQRAKLSRYPG